MSGVSTAVITTALLLVLTGCRASTVPANDDVGHHGSSVSRPTQSATPLRSVPAQPGAAQPRTAATPVVNGRPRRSLLTIPAIDVRSLPVVPYRGSPDDGPGTQIQDRGVAASPHGPRGGVGPGGIGNYIVTAHRTSSTRAFDDLPRLEVGDRAHVVAGQRRYVYRITHTRTTSFRSPRSLARQSAAVPGHPGRRPTRAMITLSTCATPEDHARGNYWADRFGNPEHRIDKIGTLIATRPA
jgi:sortase A